MWNLSSSVHLCISIISPRFLTTFLWFPQIIQKLSESNMIERVWKFSKHLWRLTRFQKIAEACEMLISCYQTNQIPDFGAKRQRNVINCLILCSILILFYHITILWNCLYHKELGDYNKFHIYQLTHNAHCIQIFLNSTSLVSLENKNNKIVLNIFDLHNQNLSRIELEK